MCTRYAGINMNLSFIAEENLKGIVAEAKKSRGTEKELSDHIHFLWHGNRKQEQKHKDKPITKEDKKGGPP